MNPFNNPLFSFFLFVGFVSLLAAFVTFKQKRVEAALAKLSPFEVAVREGFVGTEDQWLLSLPRKERRQIQFADQTQEELSVRAHAVQERFYREFRTNLANAANNSTIPFLDGVRNLLAIAEREMKSYRGRGRDQVRAGDSISLNDIVFGANTCDAIVLYAQRHKVTDMGCIGVDLMKFVENNFRVRHLNGVLYRNKGTVTYSLRCNAMAHSIIKYFQAHVGSVDDRPESTGFPFDYLPEIWLMDNEDFRREFFEVAVDATYRGMMKNAEKNAYSKTERVRNAEHENNRKHRRKRVTKSKNRN